MMCGAADPNRPFQKLLEQNYPSSDPSFRVAGFIEQGSYKNEPMEEEDN